MTTPPQLPERSELAIKIRQHIARAIQSGIDYKQCDIEVTEMLNQKLQIQLEELEREVLTEMEILEKTLYVDHEWRWNTLKHRIKSTS